LQESLLRLYAPRRSAFHRALCAPRDPNRILFHPDERPREGYWRRQR
jgi:hypothetical protein